MTAWSSARLQRNPSNRHFNNTGGSLPHRTRRDGAKRNDDQMQGDRDTGGEDSANDHHNDPRNQLRNQ